MTAPAVRPDVDFIKTVMQVTGWILTAESLTLTVFSIGVSQGVIPKSNAWLVVPPIVLLLGAMTCCVLFFMASVNFVRDPDGKSSDSWWSAAKWLSNFITWIFLVAIAVLVTSILVGVQ